ncbi:MAG: hypothetical protein QF554_03715 [Dehalococcoidia bacterium]|nr:hypothetical protein [Dehalococcoidia bacterium]
MSKLTDRLDALGRVAPAPMGFAPRPRATASATMLLLGSAPAEDAGVYADAEELDAIVLTDADDLAADATPLEALERKIWGVSIGEIDFEGLDRLKEKGCDFVVPSSDDHPATILRDDDMARGYEVDTSLTESVARALEFLPVDFLFLTPPKSPWPLKLSTLIELESTIGLVGSHFILRVEQPPSAGDLEVVRNLPVDALMIDLTATSNGDLKKYRDRIDALPPRKPRSGAADHSDATVPQTGSLTGGHQHDQEDDDWYDRAPSR